jgi:hypothetical protein
MAGSSLFLFASVALLVTGCGSSTSSGGAGGGTGTGGRIGGVGGRGLGGSGTGGAAVDAGPIFPSCTPLTATAATILNFNTPPTDPAQAQFGDFTTMFSGGTFQYPAAITSNFTGGNWHITGTVMDYSGFGIYISCKTNVAGFTGLQMDVSGNFTSNGVDDAAVPAARVTMGISQPADQLDTAHSTEVTWGTCVANCNAPSRNIMLPATTTTMMLPWTSFVGGTPVGPLDPTAILGFYFVLPWSGASTSQYNVDITIDNLMFTGGTAPPPDGGTDASSGDDAATTD